MYKKICQRTDNVPAFFVFFEALVYLCHIDYTYNYGDIVF